jgi:UDPglucose 6-dehydrogenase
MAKQGAAVRAYDPIATETGRVVLEQAGVDMDVVMFCKDAYEVAEGSDALVVVTEWNEFKALDLQRIRDAMFCPVLIDGRNIYNVAEMKRLGFIYCGIGCGSDPICSALSSKDDIISMHTAEEQKILELGD